jgi:hypothetical protein
LILQVFGSTVKAVTIAITSALVEKGKNAMFPLNIGWLSYILFQSIQNHLQDIVAICLTVPSV